MPPILTPDEIKSVIKNFLEEILIKTKELKNNGSDPTNGGSILVLESTPRDPHTGYIGILISHLPDKTDGTLSHSYKYDDWSEIQDNKNWKKYLKHCGIKDVRVAETRYMDDVKNVPALCLLTPEHIVLLEMVHYEELPTPETYVLERKYVQRVAFIDPATTGMQ